MKLYTYVKRITIETDFHDNQTIFYANEKPISIEYKGCKAQKRQAVVQHTLEIINQGKQILSWITKEQLRDLVQKLACMLPNTDKNTMLNYYCATYPLWV